MARSTLSRHLRMLREAGV
ncbi:ArsR family transcriptional regulator [Streptomyces althioticus]